MSINDNVGAGPHSPESRTSDLEGENVVLRSALAAASLGVWTWDLEDSVVCDSQAARLIGFSSVGAMTVADFLVKFKESAHEQLLEALDRARVENVVLDELLELEVSSLRTRRSLRLQGRLSSDGRILVGVCSQDESADNAVEHPLSQKTGGIAGRMHHLIGIFPGLYLEQDFDGYIRWLNSAGESVLGYTKEEITGRSFWDFVHTTDLAHTRTFMEGLMQPQKEPEGELVETLLECRCRCKSGTYIWLSWIFTVAHAQRIIYAIGRDVTDVKMQQERLSEMLKKVQDSNSELQSFVSVASHDLREPLRMITGYLRLLQTRSPEALDARAQRYINYACEGADRMRTMIEELLSYSRLGNVARRIEPVALDQVLEVAISNLAVAIKNANAEVMVDVDNSPVVAGDRSRLIRLFQNLLANSIKFHAEGVAPRVSVRFADGQVAGEPNSWVVTIQDNGIGIDSDHQEILFNVFQRLNTRDEYEGSGIGLAVCKKIAEQHHGRIWVTSERGQGSTFYVTLAKLEGAT